jgi:anti-sigma factor RsiW
MMHPQIEDEEIIERYVLNQLAVEERKAFEEHFFGCDDCFEKLQIAERFVAGVRDAASRGLLAGEGEGASRGSGWRRWLVPAFGVSVSAALVLAAIGGWLYFSQMPKLREQLSRSREDLRAEQTARAALEGQIAGSIQAELNVPLVMLQATRDVQTAPNEVRIPSGAKHLVLWVEVPAGKSNRFRLQVDTADNRAVETLDNLQRNSYGALAVSLPVEALQPGDYRIKLTAEPPPASLLAEYRLRIRRP